LVRARAAFLTSAEKYPVALVYEVEADARAEENFYKTNPRVRFIPQYIEDFLKDVPNSDLLCPNLVLLIDVLVLNQRYC
jgi:hypothetical protein